MPRNNRTGPTRDCIAGATPASATGARPLRSHPTTVTGRRGEVRIIGGRWRGRKLHFPQAADLRPTPDRVRETLFNWLQFEIAGRRCLDLFAGSGALGFEALSRGAAEVVFVERDAAAVAALRDSLRTLDCDNGTVAEEDAFAHLRRGPAVPFDVVFLDPPYGRQWLGRACDDLDARDWLTPRGWIYLEDEASRGAPVLPPGWELLRSKKAGDVGYHLARRVGSPDASTTTTGESA
jgi:16S rRNA (guanine966-N2)-methyltransferase